ncbi:efflux RND transporter periplasmic adaptor subunit [Thermincola ferriacetica]
MRGKQRIIIFSVIFAVLIAGMILYRNISFSLGKNSDQATASAKTTVQIQEVKTVEKTAVISFDATLEPVEIGIVSSKISGKVVEILFKNGEKVTKGDPLVRLDDQDIRNQLQGAQAQLQAAVNQLQATMASLPKAQANLDNATRNYNRMKALFSEGAITERDFENAETSVKVARADLDALKANVNSLRANVNSVKANINSLNTSLANTVIRAPISGIMDEKNINLGEMVSPGAVLAKVKNISTVNAVIKVKQDDLRYIKVGQKAKVKVVGDDAKAYEGIVKTITIAADPGARVFNCEIQIANEAQALRPGVFAKVEISTGQKSKIVAVPVQALTGSEGNYSVFVLEKGVARKRSVSLGEIFKDKAEVKNGLKNGEKIIVTNLNTLQDGDLVRVAGQGD